MVPSGAAGAITCGTAACITGKNTAAIQQLPDTTGLKGEVIIQKGHRILGYDHAVRATGAKLIEIETMGGTRACGIPSEATAMLVFFNTKEPDGKISAAEWIAFGKKRGIPKQFSDCSADAPPVENLMKFAKSGFDLVTVSGGKGLCGPQSAGMLFGRKDLIEAARMNTSPNSGLDWPRIESQQGRDARNAGGARAVSESRSQGRMGRVGTADHSDQQGCRQRTRNDE